MIRIRYVVNCEGLAGRFRLISTDENYRKKTFDEAITSQLLTITKNIDRWKIRSNKYGPQDYYQYLIFKMNDGAITEILP